jgi:hydroxymethylpyrimidine kinase/phosphomethylpyrimidine kinase/thiamine-phosphate diphosphorylase
MSRLLTIAGHDPVHGAGITADLATWAAMGLDGCSVVTALTVQNSQGLEQVAPVDAQLVRDALLAVLRDGEPAAIKVGMLGSLEVAREVAEFVAMRRCPVVVDPVLSGSNGRRAYHANSACWLTALWGLMQRADVITPNLPEAGVLLGMDEAQVGARLPELRALCRGAVVLKGGHGGGPLSADWVFDGERCAVLSGPRWPGSAHGSGCVFSSVVAGMLAQGWDVFEASCEAKLRVAAGIALPRAHGPGRPNTHTAPPMTSEHLPRFHWSRVGGMLPPAALAFAPLARPLGFYAVLPDADWIERALAWGVRTLQLRIKQGSLSTPELRAQLRAAVRAASEVPGAQLFINDHWREAIELGAYGVHLGQEDIDSANAAALQGAGLRLGLSSHTPLEMSRSHALRPSYAALGPVYPTTLKAMRHGPLGLARLRDWAARYQPAYPVVAIGGISLARAPQVLACGADSVAVVSALTQAADPRAAAEQFMRLMPLGPADNGAAPGEPARVGGCQ